MSLARRTMTHRALVQRDANFGGLANNWGDDSVPDWQTHIAALECKFWFEERFSGPAVDGNRSATLTRRKMIVPKGTDITENDRILNVEDRLGNEIADGPMRIDTVGYRKGHIALTLIEDR